MIKRVSMIICVAISVLIMGIANIYASEGFKVFFDGKEADYSKSGVFPQIINDRAMIPVIQSADILGVKVDLDMDSDMLHITKDGLSSFHKLGSNTVTINGVAMNYDTPTEVVNGALLMPTNMFADIVNYDTWWDNDIRSVIMRSRPKIHVSSAFTDENTPYLNDNVKFTITAPEGTVKVRLTDSGTNKVYEYRDYTIDSVNGEHKFSFDIKMTEMGDKTFSVEAGTELLYFLDDTHIELSIQNERPTEESVHKSIIALKGQYPDGMKWTNDNYYEWNGGIYSGGYGCYGFAFILSDAAFGTAPARKHNDFNNIRVGDIVRIINDTHSIVVLEIDGQTITVTEGNYNSAIHWGRTFSITKLKEVGNYILTRYPE